MPHGRGSKARRLRRQKHLQWAQRAQESVAAAVACPLCTGVTAQAGVSILVEHGRRFKHEMLRFSGSEADTVRALVLSEDREWRCAAYVWIDTYRAEHGHGPSWRRFLRERSLWPADLPFRIRGLVFQQMRDGERLIRTSVPFGMDVNGRGPRTDPAVAAPA